MRTYKLALTSVVLGTFAMAAVVVTPMSPARAAGALAEGGDSFGYSRNHESRRVAREMALGACGNSKCEIVETFEGTCIAYARGSNGVSGWARHEVENLARRRAVAKCEDRGGRDCAVKTNAGYECDNR